MSAIATGRVQRVYVTQQGHAYFRLDTEESLRPGAGRGYFTVDKDHPGFEPAVALLHTSLVSGIEVTARCADDINSAAPPAGQQHANDAEVRWLVMDSPS